MKQALLILSLICIPTFAQAHEGEDQGSSSSFVSAALRAAPPVITVLSGYVGMKKYPEHRRPIAIAMLAVLGGIAYLDPYSLIAAIGPSYCVAGGIYLGTCPCCPPGCNIIMNC